MMRETDGQAGVARLGEPAAAGRHEERAARSAISPALSGMIKSPACRSLNRTCVRLRQ